LLLIHLWAWIDSTSNSSSLFMTSGGGLVKFGPWISFYQ